MSDTQRQLIKQCLPEDVIETPLAEPPRSEEQLDKLQRVLAACDEIAKNEKPDGERWLTDHGRQFPYAIRSFVHCAASHFHQLPHVLPQDFVTPLVDWIYDSKSHVATLNYDELLYRSFVGTKVFNGYDCLIDGFSRQFDSNNLDRRAKVRQSFYLHLHGSPLYYTGIDGSLNKGSLSSVKQLEGHASLHLVLTHVKHKMSVIAASPILKEYWARLEEAMSEVDCLVLFGYSGADVHLNELIERHFSDKDVQIVERKHAEYETELGKSARFSFWEKRIGRARKVCFWRDNILDFDNWSYEHVWSS